MKCHMTAGAAILAAAVWMGGAAFAQNAENTKPLNPDEAAFLRNVAQDDLFEERLGQYAAEHAATDQTKQLGRQLATDHEADLKQVEQMAKDHGVDLSGHDSDLTPKQKTLYDRLTSKAGVNFDKDYTKLMVAEHNKMVPMYERERDHAGDVAVREYAGKMVDPLKHHLQMSQDAQKAAWGS